MEGPEASSADCVESDILGKADSLNGDNIEEENQNEKQEDDLEEEEQNEKKGEKSEDNLYAYAQGDKFTSEIFKIEIFNLPRFGFKQLKKRLANLKVNPVKIKAVDRKNFAFVTFRNEEEREDAMEKIAGHVWKGKTLNVKKAAATADPFMKKRKLDNEEDDTGKKVKLESEESTEPPEIRLRNSYSPWWNVPYEEQLERKNKDIRDVLTDLTSQIPRKNNELKKWTTLQKEKYDGLCCELLPIKPSPVMSHYRNKCEFTIGRDIHNNENKVGFRFGLYKDGSLHVGMDTDYPQTIVPEITSRLVKVFEEFLSKSDYCSYNATTYQGHWRMLTVRTCSNHQDNMIMVDFHPQKLTQDKIDTERERLKSYYTYGPGSTSGVTSVFWHCSSDRPTGGSSYEHLLGKKYVEEQLLGMKFRISPTAFFQVNTHAAEILYQQIADWCDVSSSSTVLDICCGTGTIGLSIAKRVSKIIGIEMVQSAIDDAKQNAEINGISNVEYICSKAESAIKDVLHSIDTEDVIAVLDPPRAGLHNSLIHALRKFAKINKIVFVSCKPRAGLNNFIDLSRGLSRRVTGDPFKPVKAIPVDMFPQTPHCELVVLFERHSSASIASTDTSTSEQCHQSDVCDSMENLNE